jgi:(p)ppGpp synthase/HD superfamily hydrolase
MEKQAFIDIVTRNYIWIKSFETAAFELHDRVNQKYGEILPYGFHLKLTASYVSRYGYLVAESENDVLILYAAAYLHDTIEDTRMTFNDLVKFITEFKVPDFVLPEDILQRIRWDVPEIVYALTNEKGRNRKERANATYYKCIRETKFASFVKMCDRLANIQYTTMYFFANRMLDVYRREHDEFITSMSQGAIPPVPEVMKQEAQRLLDTETYVISDTVFI